ncbi:hypothetical protein ATCV1_z306L [Acanthocystis turfacea chlorella virus 1]|uniref:Uncharacterized protein z306L n=1 Tax=Chlorovirus heliozoae TaxID=322019 RepID=A7K8R6_9PHYC|nr:hypothetical protein ATCV1_z306L [Acanthocystis turfacea chlorella virus 1]ABT16440.1 hypothetical protein ATCV1_z306L [Acanthocystis turfacea chlorella virus 1]
MSTYVFKKCLWSLRDTFKEASRDIILHHWHPIKIHHGIFTYSVILQLDEFFIAVLRKLVLHRPLGV